MPIDVKPAMNLARAAVKTKVGEAFDVAAMAVARFSPGYMAGVGIAALVTPLFEQNDERGYFATSAMTTPAILSAALIAPDMWKAGRRQASRFMDFAASATRNGSGIPESTILSNLARSGMAPATKEAELLNFYSASAGKELSQSEVGRMWKRLGGLYDRNPNMATHSVYAEYLKHASGGEAAGITNQPFKTAGSLDELQRLIQGSGKDTDPGFVRGMNWRIQQAEKLFDPGQISMGGQVWDESINWHKWGPTSAATRKLEHYNKDLFTALDQLRYAETKASRVQLVSRGSGENLQLLTAEIMFGEGKHARKLSLPIVQPDGTVWMGKEFNQRGTARGFVNRGGTTAADVNIARYANQGFSYKDLKGEMDRAIMFGMNDVESDFSAWHGNYMDTHAMNVVRRNQVVVDRLGGFKDGKGYGALNFQEKEFDSLYMMQQYGLVPASSNSMSKGVFLKADMENTIFGGLGDPEKPSKQLRTLDKPVWLTNTPELGSISPDLQPWVDTTKLTAESRKANNVFARTRVAKITAGEKALFGDLPADFASLHSPETTSSAVATIMQDAGESHEGAMRTWRETRDTLIRSQSDLDAVRGVGYLGETGYYFPAGLNDLQYTTTKDYFVQEAHLDPAVSDIAQHTLLGYDESHNAVHAGGEHNFLEGRDAVEGGYLYRVKESGALDTGTKLDILTKGLGVKAGKKEYETTRNIVQGYRDIAGKPDYWAADSEMAALGHYAHAKASVPEHLGSAAAELMHRLDANHESSAYMDFAAKAEGLGYHYNDGQLLWTATDGAARMEKTANFDELSKLIYQLFEDVGTQVKQGTIRGGAELQQWAKRGGGQGLLDWTWSNNLASNMSAWDSSKLNRSTQTGITMDYLQGLHMRGHHETVSEILGRLQRDGDPRMTRELAEHLDANHFKTPLGEVVPLGEAFPQSTEGSLTSLREGSVLSPADPRAFKNYSVALPDGSFVPVLGHEAYGGKVNRFGAGQYSANERERAFMDIARAQSPEELHAAKAAYVEEIKKVTLGKEGILRQFGTDPFAISGTLTERASPSNPFQMGIDADLIKGIQDRDMRRAFSEGKLRMSVRRHPISYPEFFEVVADPRLKGTGLMGYDSLNRIGQRADMDKDTLEASALHPGGAADLEAERAMAKGGLQEQELAMHRAFQGAEDVERMAHSTAIPSVSKRVEEFLAKQAKATGIYRSRMAGGATGFASNVLTEMMAMTEAHKTITDPLQRSTLGELFFSVRQHPIWAMKQEGGQGLDVMMKFDSFLKNSIGPKGNFNDFYQSMNLLADTMGKKSRERAASLGITLPEGEQNVAKAFVTQRKDLLQNWWEGRDTNISEFMPSLTHNSKTGGAMTDIPLANLKKMGNRFGYAQAASHTRTAATGAERSASALGDINTLIRSAGKDFKTAMSGKGAGKILGIGLGVAAAAGVLTASLGDHVGFSSNRYRPEEMGPTDGGAEVGSESSQPSMTLQPAASQVNTAIVAPIQQAVNLEVKTRVADRNQATERARTLARITGGSSRVTVNYRGDPGRHSLRGQQQIRDHMNRVD